MEFSNFKITKTIGSNALDLVYFGEVDVITGSIFKTIVRRKVFREFASLWRFLDTGEPAPWHLDNMERAYKAKERLESEK